MNCERCGQSADTLYLGRSYRYQDGAGFLRWANHRDIALCDACHATETTERRSAIFVALTLCNDYRQLAVAK